MAIQQVGGRGVYVITGSGRDPRKTSNGQSWADLVTQQKYMLIKQARQDAQREIDREFQDYQSRQKALTEYRADVRKQIDEARATVTSLKLKQSEAQTGIDKQLLKAEIDRARGRKQTITSGSGGNNRGRASKEMSSAEFNRYLTEEIAANQSFSIKTLEDAANDAEAQKLQQLINARNPEYYTPAQQGIFDALSESQKSMVTAAQEGQKEVDRLVQVRSEFNLKKTQSDQEGMREIIKKEQGLPAQPKEKSGGGYQVRTEKYKDQTDLPDAPTVDYSELITPYEQRIKSLEQQLLEAESPTMPDFNETNRMRQRASEDYGLRTSYRPPEQPVEPTVERQPVEQPVERRAEMDTLGIKEPVAETVAEPSSTPLESAMQQGDVERDRPRESLGGIEQPTVDDEVLDERIAPQPTQQIVEDDFNIEDFITNPDPVLRNPLTGNISENVRPYVQGRATEKEIFNMNAALNDPETYMGLKPGHQAYKEKSTQLLELLDEREKQYRRQATPAPTPTPTRNIRDVYNTMLQSEEQTEPSMASMFDSVRFGTAQQKQQLALKMIMEKAQELGPTNPAYLKVKKSILKQLEKVLDPKKARQQRLVEKNQSDNRGDYFALARQVRGLKEQNAQLVFSLFPVNQESKAEEADGLYKNAQKQIATNISDRLQRKKAQEFLDLMYLAYMNER